MSSVVETFLAVVIGVARQWGTTGFLDFARNDKVVLEVTKRPSK